MIKLKDKLSLNVKIRPIEKTDHEALIAMFSEFASFQKMPEKMVNTLELMTEETDYMNGFVAENASGELLGYATYFYAYFTWVGKSLYMDDLYVKPDNRRKGLGKALINTVINKAKSENCKKVRWQVSSWNQNAIDFYNSMGARVSSAESNCDYWLIDID